LKATIDILTNGAPVTECSADGVVYGGKPLSAKTIVWAAGVQASPAARWLGAASDRAGRVVVGPDLTVAGRLEVFAIGDTASCTMADGKPVPGIAPAAKQQGKYVANLIGRRLKGKSADGPFNYRHQGNLATIGRSLAVIDMGRVKLRGGLEARAYLLPDQYAKSSERRFELVMEPQHRLPRLYASSCMRLPTKSPRRWINPALWIEVPTLSERQLSEMPGRGT